MRTFVSLDLETTGLDPERDAIIEIGIVRFRGDEIVEDWSSLINPGREIPPKIEELTGITNAMVRESGIPLYRGLSEAQRVIGNLPIVGHNVMFDVSFMRRQRMLAANPTIDTFELAGILIPHAGQYSLSALANELGIELTDAHRALNDAYTTHQLYLKLFERAVELPRDVLEEITQHAKRSGWTLADFWQDALETQARGVFTTNLGARLQRSKTGQSAVARRAALKARAEARPLKSVDEPTPLDEEKVAHLLDSDGPFAQRFEGYEMRPQQVEMLRTVVTAFNEAGHALIEAGTGTGKSVAYLIPAILWAQQNGERVVVSTNTINLQEQLAEKDVPAIVEALGLSDTRAAVMKGKSRYLCPLRLNDLRRAGPKTQDEVRLLTKILIWLPNTLTGDGDELFIPAPGERAAFARMSAQNPACNLNTCSATDCYFHQARRMAESAHVVIVNHALLLADIAVENRALPEYHYLVIDEGHHLESAATDSLAYKIDRDELLRQLSELISTSGRRASGLLVEISNFAHNQLPVAQGAALETLTSQSADVVGRAASEGVAFFDELQEFLSDRSGNEPREYSQRIRVTRSFRGEPGWTRVELVFEKLLNELSVLSRNLHNLSMGMNELSDTGGAGNMAGEKGDSLDMLLARVIGARRFLDEAIEQMNAIVSKPNDQSIYWVEMSAERMDRGGSNRRSSFPSQRVTLNAAPLHVGQLMRQFIWDAKKSVVLTSATIRTATPATRSQPTFDHIQERLDASNAMTLAVGSPFDYPHSTLLYLVSDMPEPNQPSYQQYVERALVELFRASQGRGMALFTSYSQLRATAKVVAPQLQREGIVVYEQGDGTSRRIMLEQFRAAERGVLFGTRSFWEGVDIQGEKLSALAICKLPFDVPTDPIFSARSETYENPFNEYSVPETVLRFRQGFGRLIRSKSDRGVIVVLDRRLISKNYGAAFLNALPAPTVRRGMLSGLGASVAEWLK
ncbi:MAG: exonuclease domain-containing protein [Chloroflexi bacterium]|nr:exonuclease domain-containing protein [Chloroflexota bacterium]